MFRVLRCPYTYVLPMLFVILISSYSNTFYSPPILDDFHSFVLPESLRVNDWSMSTMKSLGHTLFGWGRWLPVLTFSWDLWYGKGEIFFFHLTNLLIHSICLLAVIFLVYQLTKCSQRQNPSEGFRPRPGDIALWVAGLWALHPVQTNAVTYLVQRMASLVALFSVLCVAFYVAARLIHRERERLGSISMAFYLLSFLSMALAFLCKQNAAMIPIVLLCTEAWFFTPDVFRRLFVFARKHRLISIAAILVAMIGIWHAWPMLVNGYDSRHFTRNQRLLTEARVVIWYISILLYPNPGRLSLEHDIVISTSPIQPLSTLFSIIALAGLATFAVIKRKRFPLTTYGIMWFLLNLAIESSFLSLELVFEHRLYLPSVGLILSIVVMACNLMHWVSRRTSEREFRKLAWCVVGILSAVLSLTTFERNEVWHDGVTLNQDNVLKAPNNPRAHANLALALERAQRYEEAVKEASTAIQLGTRGYEAHFVAANVIVSTYILLGKYETAIEEGERLLTEAPPDCDKAAWPNLHINLAMAYREKGDLIACSKSIRRALVDYSRLPKNDLFDVDGALALLRSTLYAARAKGIELDQDVSLDQNNVPIETQIAQMLLQLGYRDHARRLLEQAAMNNEQGEQGNRLLQAFLDEDRLNSIQESKKSFTQEYVRHPFSRFNTYMAIAFLIQKKQLPSPFMEIGQVALARALELRPDSADAQLLQGWYHFRRNDSEEAVTAARKALNLDPDYSKAWVGLGLFLTKAGHSPQAVDAFQRSLELYPGCPERMTIVGIIASLRGDQEKSAQVVAKDEHIRTN